MNNSPSRGWFLGPLFVLFSNHFLRRPQLYGIEIEGARSENQYRQLYRQLRERILEGDFNPGERLASTRELASSLKLSRNIVLEVMDQLALEGFVESRQGSGTFVSSHLVVAKRTKPGSPSPPPLQTGAHAAQKDCINLVAGFPDPELFPRRAWSRCYSQVIEYAGTSTLGYPSPGGEWKLREEIAGYLYRSKGISVDPSQVFITSGTAGAMGILSELAGNHGDKRAVLEDPMAPFIRPIFESRGFALQYFSVDEEGLIPGSWKTGPADYLYACPSHQFPLGGVLPMKRRNDLIEQARAAGAYIVEDDYDGEFRHEGRPLAPLQILDPERVIFIGSFSKIFSPAFRLGYMVVPPKLSAKMLRLSARWDLLISATEQATLASFMQSGALEKQLRRNLKHYRNKKQKIEEIIAGQFDSDCAVGGSDTGLHLVLGFKGRRFDEQDHHTLMSAGIRIKPVSMYSINYTQHSDKIVLGYGQSSLNDIARGLGILASYLTGKTG